MTIRDVLDDVEAELKRATAKFPVPFNSPHEGISIINEERDELWDEIKANCGRKESARKEAIQVATMAVRYVWDICTPPEEKA